MIGIYETVLPKEVPSKMESLLEWYHSLPQKNLSYLAEFHAKYESIHPFQDGNGRTGRLILFRECLKEELIPFVIEDQFRTKYIEGLKEYRNTEKPNFFKNYLQRNKKNLPVKYLIFLAKNTSNCY